MEGEDDEESFEKTKVEILESIQFAKNHKNEIPFSVFKITGIGSRDLLTKIQNPRFYPYFKLLTQFLRKSHLFIFYQF